MRINICLEVQDPLTSLDLHRLCQRINTYEQMDVTMVYLNSSMSISE